MDKKVDMIKLEEVIDMCAKYHNQEISLDEFKGFADKIFIQKYIPISQKATMINYILLCDEFLGVSDESILSMEIELKKFFRIMLAYTNIDTADSDHLMTMHNYDLIMMYLGDVIESFCKQDYSRTINMLENAMNYSNINNLLNLITYTYSDNSDMSNDLSDTLKLLNDNRDILDKVSEVIKFDKPVLTDKFIKENKNDDDK